MQNTLINTAMSALLSALPIIAFSAPDKEQLLLTASMVNIDEAIAHECDRSVPDYWLTYKISLDALTVEVLEPMGIDKSVRARAAQIPEVAPPQYVKSFQSSSTEQKLKHCLKILIDIQGGLHRARQNTIK